MRRDRERGIGHGGLVPVTTGKFQTENENIHHSIHRYRRPRLARSAGLRRSRSAILASARQGIAYVRQRIVAFGVCLPRLKRGTGLRERNRVG